MIDVTHLTTEQKVKLIKKAYELSRPQSFGLLHFMPNDELSDEQAQQLINKDGIVNLDYVRGRACKLRMYKKDDGTLFFRDEWYDHTNEQYTELLASIGINKENSNEHGIACNCDDCRAKRGDKPYDASTISGTN